MAHFHEWQAAVALLLLSQTDIKLATLFTTHATLLGRYLSAGGSMDFYNRLPSVNPDHEASIRGIHHRHRIEALAAGVAKIFTTVSDITGYEAEQILKKKPDRITPNGLRLDRSVALHEFQNRHALYKAKINDFITGHFYGYFDFDLDNTLYCFTAGRYEYYNKGVDLFIDALAELNKKLKEEKSKQTVVAFIIMPAKTNNFNIESLKGQSILKKVRETTEIIAKDLQARILDSVCRSQLPDATTLLTAEDKIALKRGILSLKRSTLPPIVTHNMVDDATDPILNHLRRLQMFNNPEDRVKVIFHPEFLSSTNPLLSLEYDQFVRGCHLGVFPSYYEPWGYTPAECTVMGIPSVSSNLTGFANYIQKKVPNHEAAGIYVVDRRYRSYAESLAQITGYLHEFCHLTRRERIDMRNRCERLSELLDWDALGHEYQVARSMAMDRTFGVKLPVPQAQRGAGLHG
jgi:glycogen(starch) synthase